MDINLENKNLEPSERQEILTLLHMQNPNISNDLEQMWYLLNRVWHNMGCDNKHLDWEKIGKFYAHPVWILNGLFIESHELSLHIRKAIAQYIASLNPKRVCDYGGGFGSLAKEIAKLCPHTQIDIYEPFPSSYGKKCVEEFSNVAFVSTLKENYYDCLVSTDVLEHVDNVLHTFESMLVSLTIGGKALIGNCFYPVIECHLPKHFHYRYTFRYIATMMGVSYNGSVEGTEYVEIYTKHKKSRVNFTTKLAGGGSKCLFAIMPILKPILKPLLKVLKHFASHTKDSK